MNPGKIVRATRDGRRHAVPLPARPPHAAARHRARLVGVGRQPRSGGRDLHGARHRRRSGEGLRQGRRDVQQQRPLPQVRRRHDVPELPRHARRAASHARPRQHAAARAVGPARTRRPRLGGRARRARAVRELQGLPPRVPDRRRHGEDEDRVPVPLAAGARPAVVEEGDRPSAALGAVGGAIPVARQPARRAARGGEAHREMVGLLGAGARCPRGGAMLSCAAPRRPTRAPRKSCCSSTRSTTISNRRTRGRR